MSYQTSAITIIVCALFAILQQQVAAQIVVGGPCPRNVQTIEDFDATSYLGKWYEYSKYPFIFELNGKCITADYGQLPDGRVSVLNTQINTITNRTQKIEGSAEIVSSGKLSVRFGGFAALGGASDYWILDTDYQNYATVYSCTNFLIVHTRVVWILTRQAQPSKEILAAAENAITSNGLSLDPLTKTDQQNC